MPFLSFLAIYLISSSSKADERDKAKIADGEFRKAVDRADEDKDGKLNLDEFAWWYTVDRKYERNKNS